MTCAVDLEKKAYAQQRTSLKRCQLVKNMPVVPGTEAMMPPLQERRDFLDTQEPDPMSTVMPAVG